MNREVFLERLAETGGKFWAARDQGMSVQDVDDLMAKDAQFKSEVGAALEMYHQKVVALITEKARSFLNQGKYDRHGNCLKPDDEPTVLRGRKYSSSLVAQSNSTQPAEVKYTNKKSYFTDLRLPLLPDPKISPTTDPCDCRLSAGHETWCEQWKAY